MILKTCKDCGGEVSAHAKICPTCGRPQLRTATKFALTVWAAVGFVFLVALAIGLKQSYGRDLPGTETSTAMLTRGTAFVCSERADIQKLVQFAADGDDDALRAYWLQMQLQNRCRSIPKATKVFASETDGSYPRIRVSGETEYYYTYFKSVTPIK